MNNKLKMILLSAQTLMLMGCPMIDSEVTIQRYIQCIPIYQTLNKA